MSEIKYYYSCDLCDFESLLKSEIVDHLQKYHEVVEESELDSHYKEKNYCNHEEVIEYGYEIFKLQKNGKYKSVSRNDKEDYPHVFSCNNCDFESSEFSDIEDFNYWKKRRFQE